MSSAVYFKFKASIKQYTIPFDGSAISVKDLRSAIRLSCGLKSTDFELQILDKQGKEYAKEDDLIPKFSDLIVRRLPKANDLPRKKIANPEDMTKRDPYKAINSLPKINPYSSVINLAKSNIPDDEKIDIMAKRCSEEYSEKNFLVKSKPYGIPPASYVCNKCHQGGHWIHECPGLRDKDGRLLDFKSVKRPTGIPQDFLLEVSPGTPGAYLTKEGKYMVPIKDAEAYAMGKKEKRPFSVEENPPYVPKDQEYPSKIKCSLCSRLLENPTCTPCCSSVYCEKCITDFLYDPEVNGSRKCPNCQSLIEHHTSLIEHELLRQLIQCWKANLLTKEIVDSCVTTLNHSSNKKTELNEDSSKSPDMKFESASNNIIPEVDNSSVIKPEITEKVFVNNRRVLKPKTATQQLRTDSPSNIKPSTPEKVANPTIDNKVDVINNIDVIKTNENQAIDVVKTEKVVNNSLIEADVNDLIFEKVQDYDTVSSTTNNSNESRSDKNRDTKNSSKLSDQNNLRIETVVKRTDNNNNSTNNNGSSNSVLKNNLIDRKIDNGKMSNSNLKSHLNDMSTSSLHQTFGAMLNPTIDTTPQQQPQQLINHFPAATTQLVTSVQQQFLNNPIPMGTLEPLQWPLLNSMYNGIPLQTMFGAAMNSASNPSNWIGNGLNIAPSQGINSNRILTKEEFYERQRRLRAEKMKQRYRDANSRSPSGSQSPRRKHKSHSKYDYRDKYERKYSSSSKYKVPLKDSSKPRVDNNHEDFDDRDSSRSSRRRQPTNHYQSPNERSIGYKNADFPNQDIKKIDPKLMEDSINTFLKYLAVNPDDGNAKQDTVLPPDNKRRRESSGNYRPRSGSRHQNSSSNKSTKMILDTNLIVKPRNSRRSTRSRSVPKISKDRLEDVAHQRQTATVKIRRLTSSRDENTYRHSEPPEPQREVIARHSSSRDIDPIDNVSSSHMVVSQKEKKSKKSKHRENSDDEDKRKKKHKKHHKHKKVKKVKKEKKADS